MSVLAGFLKFQPKKLTRNDYSPRKIMQNASRWSITQNKYSQLRVFLKLDTSIYINIMVIKIKFVTATKVENMCKNI